MMRNWTAGVAVVAILVLAWSAMPQSGGGTSGTANQAGRSYTVGTMAVDGEEGVKGYVRADGTSPFATDLSIHIDVVFDKGKATESTGKAQYNGSKPEGGRAVKIPDTATTADWRFWFDALNSEDEEIVSWEVTGTINL